MGFCVCQNGNVRVPVSALSNLLSTLIALAGLHQSNCVTVSQRQQLFLILSSTNQSFWTLSGFQALFYFTSLISLPLQCPQSLSQMSPKCQYYIRQDPLIIQLLKISEFL